MNKKYDRSNFLVTQIVDDIDEKDLVTNTFEYITFKNQMIFYTIVSEDIGSPDLISMKVYGRQDFWWIIMKVNNIEDVYNDYVEGQVLRIPAREDIERYYLNMKKAKK